MLAIIVGLFLLGLCLISLELLVPGGILGLVGVLSLLGSWTVAFVEYGVAGGMLAVLIGCVVIGISLTIELKFIPRTTAGQRLFLKGSIGGTSQRSVAPADMTGKQGKTVTTLAPTGVVEIDGKTYEGFSLSGLVERGARVEVVDADNFRVRVKKI